MVTGDFVVVVVVSSLTEVRVTTSVNWTRYMELSRRFHVLVSTLRLSFGRVFSFILSVTPIFVAFLMLGLSVFSQFSARFATLDQVAVTLVSEGRRWCGPHRFVL